MKPVKPKPIQLYAPPEKSGKPAAPAPQGAGAASSVMDEEAHFRIDELERKAEAMGEVLDPQALMGFFTGAAAAMQADLRSEMLKLRDAQLEDVKTDREVVAELKQVCAALRELCVCLASPIQRTSTVNLPSGPVSVTVRETRQ